MVDNYAKEQQAKADGSNPELVKAVEELLGAEEKIKPNDKESKQGQVSSSVGKGEATIKAESDKGAGGGKAESGGVVQGAQEVVTEIDKAKQDLKNAWKEFKNASDITKLGITGKDPEKAAEAMYKVHQALVNLAKQYASKGIKVFAREVGLKIKDVQKAWDEATGVKVYAKEDLDYNMADMVKTSARKAIDVREKISEKLQEQKAKTKEVSERIKAINQFVKDYSDRGNLTRADLIKITDLVATVKDQKSLDRAADKIYEIIDNAKSDKIEVYRKTSFKSAD